MICNEIIQILEQLSPAEYAFSWDNVGLMVGDRQAEVKKILVTLDADDKAVQKAVEIGADMIITHHPLIFGNLKQVTSDTFIGRRIMTMIQNNICCFSMHTNFDVKGGMEQLAADMLNMENPEVLRNSDKEEIGRTADFKDKLTVGQWSERVKAVFGLSSVILFGDENNLITRVAVAPGSGGDSLKPAADLGVQLVITGDIGHHKGIDAVAMGLSVIDAGHYGIEHIFINYISEYLERKLRNVEVARMEKCMPYKIM